MKTPKRQYTLPYWHTGKLAPAHPKEQAARWKRKNRVAQLKHTIARLNRELSLFVEPENFDLICDALVTHAAQGDSETRNRSLDLLILFTFDDRN